MVRIKINPREIELLNLCYNTLGINKNFAIKEDSIIITNNELQNLDIMFNCVLDTFVKIGLLKNDEPNEIGLELEKLNEKINHEFVKLNK